MPQITHKQQQDIWEKEHQTPYVLLQMDSKDPSSGVVKFWQWLQKNSKASQLNGLEICCGKGRSCIWLAQQGANITGFDFSATAIQQAQRRAKEAELEKKSSFIVQDATKPWQLESDSFDFAIDCFGTTDIESPTGRKFAAQEAKRVLKPGGYLLVYTLSTDDEFHKEMIGVSPAQERNAFYHPTTGKFEKTFDRDELLNLYSGMELVKEERVEKTAEFFGKKYKCKHHWMIFRKN